MWNIILESFNLLVIFAILFFFLREGKKSERLRLQPGWKRIAAGFCLIFSGALLDLSDNFPSLSRFQILGDTPLEAFVEKALCFLGGYIFVFLGMKRWLPQAVKLDETIVKLQSSRRDLMEANAELDTLNERLHEEIRGHKEAMESLAEAETKFRILVEQSLAGIYIIRNGTYVYVNPKMSDIYRRGREELLAAERVSSFVVPEDRAVVEENIRKRLSREVENTHYTFRISRGDGSVAEVEVFGTRADLQGTPAVIGIMLDITERKKLEEDLRHMQKMEAMGLLAGGVAHDFNNILTAIIGYGTLIEMKAKDDGDVKHHIQQVLMAADRAASLTSGLLAFSRKGGVNSRPVNVNEAVKSIEKFLRRLIGEDIDLCTSYTEDKPTIMIDPGQLDQILINLVANARDAMPNGGRLSISTDIRADKGAPLDGSASQGGTSAVIAVSDTGAGMARHTVERIFEPFFTTKEVGKGTGLGLSIVHGIVRQHNGRIECRSEQGKGTTFLLGFPVVAPAIMVEDMEPSFLHCNGIETILLVEDDADVRKLMGSILLEFGYQVVEAVDGEEAVRLFHERSNEIDLTILDVVMPKRNGQEVLEEIRKIRREARVVMVSGYTADILDRKGIADNGIDLLAKPILPTELLKKVREVLDANA